MEQGRSAQKFKSRTRPSIYQHARGSFESLPDLLFTLRNLLLQLETKEKEKKRISSTSKTKKKEREKQTTDCVFPLRYTLPACAQFPRP
jgi:hypothetical protein